MRQQKVPMKERQRRISEGLKLSWAWRKRKEKSMTIPHLMNCDHSPEWCLDCVKKMHDELEQRAEAAEQRADKAESELLEAMQTVCRLDAMVTGMADGSDYKNRLVEQSEQSLATIRALAERLAKKYKISICAIPPNGVN